MTQPTANPGENHHPPVRELAGCSRHVVGLSARSAGKKQRDRAGHSLDKCRHGRVNSSSRANHVERRVHGHAAAHRDARATFADATG